MSLQVLYKNMWFSVIGERIRLDEKDLLLHSRKQYKVDIWITLKQVEEVRQINHDKVFNK